MVTKKLPAGTVARLEGPWSVRREGMTGNVMEREDRPWGYFEVMADMAECKIKRIVVHPGCRLSLQRHRLRSEHWLIVSGSALVTVDRKDMPLEEGGSIDIPRGCLHRMKNVGTADLTFIEVQTGDYFGEDDIERLEDDYGRA